MKLVDMGDSKSPSERSGGSSPPAGTTFYNPDQIGRGFFMSEIWVLFLTHYKRIFYRYFHFYYCPRSYHLNISSLCF